MNRRTWLALFAAGAGVSAAAGAGLSGDWCLANWCRVGAGVSAAAPPPGTLIL